MRESKSASRLLDEIREKLKIDISVTCKKGLFYLWEKREAGYVMLCRRDSLETLKEYLEDMLTVETELRIPEKMEV